MGRVLCDEGKTILKEKNALPSANVRITLQIVTKPKETFTICLQILTERKETLTICLQIVTEPKESVTITLPIVTKPKAIVTTALPIVTKPKVIVTIALFCTKTYAHPQSRDKKLGFRLHSASGEASNHHS